MKINYTGAKTLDLRAKLDSAKPSNTPHGSVVAGEWSTNFSCFL